MNREDIIRMAREAGFQCLLPSEHTDATGCVYDSGDEEITPLLKRFASLVAEHEREACAKFCEEQKLKYEKRAAESEEFRDISPEVARIAGMTCDFNAAAIRARGQA